MVVVEVVAVTAGGGGGGGGSCNCCWSVVEVVAVTARRSMAVVVDIHFCCVWVVLRLDFKSTRIDFHQVLKFKTNGI